MGGALIFRARQGSLTLFKERKNLFLDKRRNLSTSELVTTLKLDMDPN